MWPSKMVKASDISHNHVLFYFQYESIYIMFVEFCITTYQYGAINKNGPDTPIPLTRACGHLRDWKQTFFLKPHTSMGPLHRTDQTHPCYLYKHVCTAEGGCYYTKPHTSMGPLHRVDQTHPCHL